MNGSDYGYCSLYGSDHDYSSEMNYCSDHDYSSEMNINFGPIVFSMLFWKI